MLSNPIMPNLENNTQEESRYVSTGLLNNNCEAENLLSGLYLDWRRFLNPTLSGLGFVSITRYTDSNLSPILNLLSTYVRNPSVGAVSMLTVWVLPVLLTSAVVIALYVASGIPFTNLLFLLTSAGLLVYLLISGFVFFLNNYNYANYTTSMHRFWSSCLSIFWLLEGYLFLVFLYLTVFSNQEPFFMYDNIQAFKDFCCPWAIFLNESALLVFLIFTLKSALLSSKNNIPSSVFLYLIAGLWILVYVCWCEFNQFLYTLGYYNTVDWTYDPETYTWSIEPEINRASVMLHFITICLIAKFWHFVFILGFWVFSLANWAQSDNTSLSLLGANLQNVIILYLLNWIFMFPWLNLAFRNFLFNNYSWLYVNISTTGPRLFFSELLSYTWAVLTLFGDLPVSLCNLGNIVDINSLISINPISVEMVRSFWDR